MRFSDWVASEGNISKVARDLGVHRPSIYLWMRVGGPPALDSAADIVRVSGGKVSFRDLVEGRREVELKRRETRKCG